MRRPRHKWSFIAGDRFSAGPVVGADGTIFFGSWDGKLYAVNVLTLSSYLEGVLPGEMMPTFPLEALKAQAVAARTFFLYNFGRRYRDMPFDVTDDVYSQADAEGFIRLNALRLRIRKLMQRKG